jgi:hypothetical protein
MKKEKIEQRNIEREDQPIQNINDLFNVVRGNDSVARKLAVAKLYWEKQRKNLTKEEIEEWGDKWFGNCRMPTIKDESNKIETKNQKKSKKFEILIFEDAFAFSDMCPVINEEGLKLRKIVEIDNMGATIIPSSSLYDLYFNNKYLLKKDSKDIVIVIGNISKIKPAYRIEEDFKDLLTENNKNKIMGLSYNGERIEEYYNKLRENLIKTENKGKEEKKKENPGSSQNETSESLVNLLMSTNEIYKLHYS